MKEEDIGGLGRRGWWGHPHGVDYAASACCHGPCCGVPYLLLFVSEGLVVLVFAIEGVPSI